jgi:hypothetical protein
VQRVVGGIVLAAVMVLGLPPAATAQLARCDWHTQSFHLNDVVAIGLTISEGHPGCGRTMRIGGTMVANSLRVVRQADHGRVAIAGRSGYGYRPNPGFRGRDRFTLELLAEQRGRTGRVVLNVTVDVVPRGGRTGVAR